VEREDEISTRDDVVEQSVRQSFRRGPVWAAREGSIQVESIERAPSLMRCECRRVCDRYDDHSTLKLLRVAPLPEIEECEHPFRLIPMDASKRDHSGSRIGTHDNVDRDPEPRAIGQLDHGEVVRVSRMGGERFDV